RDAVQLELPVDGARDARLLAAVGAARLRAVARQLGEREHRVPTLVVGDVRVDDLLLELVPLLSVTLAQGKPLLLAVELALLRHGDHSSNKRQTGGAYGLPTRFSSADPPPRAIP